MVIEARVGRDCARSTRCREGARENDKLCIDVPASCVGDASSVTSQLPSPPVQLLLPQSAPLPTPHSASKATRILRQLLLPRRVRRRWALLMLCCDDCTSRRSSYIQINELRHCSLSPFCTGAYLRIVALYRVTADSTVS